MLVYILIRCVVQNARGNSMVKWFWIDAVRITDIGKSFGFTDISVNQLYADIGKWFTELVIQNDLPICENDLKKGCGFFSSKIRERGCFSNLGTSVVFALVGSGEPG